MRNASPSPGPADCLPSAQWQLLEDLVERFEESWQRGQRPALADFLPADSAVRGPVLAELVLTELECRLKAGQAARVEEYLEQFPALQADRDYVVRLIAKDYELRRRREPNLQPAEFLERFPAERGALLTRLMLPPKGPLDQSPAGRPGPAAPPVAIAGYEILEELGRGGMGVVYKAKQPGLQRLVAIKTIGGEPAAGPEQCQRLQAEARAVARLHHPNIVQVHEVGEHAGRPYVSLEFVDGGTLAQRIGGRPQPIRHAAALLEMLAHAMDYAHRQGIVHRDLKPANILLTAQGMPKITDFGLAKCAQEAGQTRTGAVLGTPSYIAPEQASGKKDVGPVADVYSLGAILYELLTGRPPYRGDTAMGTLVQVISGSLSPPSQHNPRVPRDLETICLKCMERDPGRRYPTAAALADDLHRFLNGESIKARPVNRAIRLLRWGRRRPMIAGLLAATLLLVFACLAGAVLIAVKDRQTLLAENKAQEAELGRQADQLKAAERAQRRLKAFEPYAEATDLLMRAQVADIVLAGQAHELLPAGRLYEGAAKLLEEATRIDTDFPEAQFALAEAYRLGGLPSRAAEAYLHANELNLKVTGRAHLQALVAAGMAYEGAADYKNADRAFAQAERDGAGQPLALVGKSLRLVHARRPTEARAIAEEALRLAPHLWETHFACGSAVLHQVNMGYVPPRPDGDRGYKLVLEAWQLSPRQAEVWAMLAQFSAKRSDCIRFFDNAVAMEGRNPNRYVMRCLFRQGLGDTAAATADLEKARELGASPLLLLEADAQLVFYRGDRETAFRFYGQLVQEAPEWPSFLANWFIVGIALRRDSEFRGRLDEWCRSNPDCSEVYRVKGQLKARDGDFAGAVAEARAGLKIAPYERNLRRDLAYNLVSLRNWPEAFTAADATLEVCPGDYVARMIRAQCLAQMGRGPEANAVLDALEKDFPEKATEIDTLRRTLGSRLVRPRD